MRAALLILFFVALPIAYLYTLVNRIVTKRTRGLGLSFLVFVAAALTAAWALSKSKTDWAPVAMFGVQGEAALAGFLALEFIEWRDAPSRELRIAAWFGLLASVAIIVFNVLGGSRNVATNRAAGFAHGISFPDPTLGVWETKFEIAYAMKQDPEHAKTWLDSTVRARLQDSVFLAAALTYDFLSTQTLDTLASSAFQPVALGAVVNPGTTGRTLAKTYERRSGLDPFMHALAQNRHTPPDILGKIYSQPHNSIGTEIALAANPGTPPDVLRSLAKSPKHPETIHALLGNQVVDCALLVDVESYLAGKERSRARAYNDVRMKEVRSTVCSSSTIK